MSPDDHVEPAAPSHGAGRRRWGPSELRGVLVPARLRPADLLRIGSVGLRTRRVRAALSGLGIAIGVATMVGVLGISSSSQAGLLAEIDAIGTNLLTVTTGQTPFGQTAELPRSSPGMIGRIGPVQSSAAVGTVSQNVYRSNLIPSTNTEGITLDAAQPNLLSTLRGTMQAGRFLNAATARYPTVVLGAVAAQRLGIDRVQPNERVWLGGQWFYVSGIMSSFPLAPEIDRAVLVGFPVAEALLHFDGAPTTVYVRTDPNQVQAVESVLAATANPEHPDQVNVSRPSDALVARADAQSAFTGLFLGLGAIALLVGGVGVANIMVISVLERRSEIGLRRALGATRGQVRFQFLSEAVFLSAIGGGSGVVMGILVTAVYASTRAWAIVVPPSAIAGGLGAGLVIGAIAGVVPAMRAAGLAPTEALRTV
jgi:putative ABC transport system permease protein